MSKKEQDIKAKINWDELNDFGLASMKKIMDNISILKHMHQIGDYPAN